MMTFGVGIGALIGTFVLAMTTGRTARAVCS